MKVHVYQRNPLSYSKPSKDFPPHLRKSLPYPGRPCMSAPVSLSDLTSYHSPCLPNTVLTIPRTRLTGCHLRSPFTYKTFSPGFSMPDFSLFSNVFSSEKFRLITSLKTVSATLYVCWLHFLKNHLHYTFICLLCISPLRV